MGLDMYLVAKRFFWSDERKKKKYKDIGKNFPEMEDFELEQVTFDVGYWRKSNEIHKWFVENVQNNEDNCGDYYVSEEQLRELLDLVNQVLENHKLAEELLPTQSGFFFGSTDYDEYYFQSLEKTKTIIEKILKIINFKEFDIEYHSSW